MSLELAILDGIQDLFGCALLDTLMPLVTALGNAGIVWIVCAVLLLLRRSTRKTGLSMAAALILELLVCNLLLKPLVDRVRPFELNTAVQLLITAPADGSFPSGHTGASFASTVVLFRSRSRLRWPALLLSILIAFSRLYLYVHFPTDVLAGVVIGSALGWLGWQLVDSLYRRRSAAAGRP